MFMNLFTLIYLFLGCQTPPKSQNQSRGRDPGGSCSHVRVMWIVRFLSQGRQKSPDLIGVYEGL